MKSSNASVIRDLPSSPDGESPKVVGMDGIQHLGAGVRLFLRLADNYVLHYPKESFIFTFDGRTAIAIGKGERPARVWFEDSAKTLADIWRYGSVAQGEAYCDKKISGNHWDVSRYAEMMGWFCDDARMRKTLSFFDRVKVYLAIKRSSVTRHGISHDRDVNSHYSLETWLKNFDDVNKFFAAWLGKYPVYSCGIWHHGAKTLDQAQLDKFNHYAKLLDLKKGTKLLDLGCGWAAQSLHYAENLGVNVTLVTLARSQAKYVRDEVRRRGLEKLVTLHEMNMLDIDKLPEKFDCIMSLGAIEHLTDKERDILFSKGAKQVVPGGRAIWHTMFNGVHHEMDAWFAKFMWPGVNIPCKKRLLDGLNAAYPTVEFHPYPYQSYTRTFECWTNNFFEHRAELMAIFERGSCPNPDRVLRGFEWYLICCSIVYNIYMDVGFGLAKT